MTSNLDAKPKEAIWGAIGRTRSLLNLVLISLSYLFGGVSLSLLAPRHWPSPPLHLAPTPSQRLEGGRDLVVHIVHLEEGGERGGS